MTKSYEWGTATNLTVCIQHGSHFGFLIFPGQRIWIARSTDFIAETVNVSVFCESCGRRKELLCDTERTVEEDLDQALQSRRRRGFGSLDPAQVPWIVENGSGIDVGAVPLPPVPLPAEGEPGVNQAFEYFVNRTYCCSICNAEFNGEGGFIERTQKKDSEDLFCYKCGCSWALSQSFAFQRAFGVSPLQVGTWSGMNVDIFWSHRNVEYDHYIPQVFWDRYRNNRGHGERARICQDRRQEEAKKRRRESGNPLLAIAIIVIVALMFLVAISSSGLFTTNYEGMSGEEQLRYLEADFDDRGGSPY